MATRETPTDYLARLQRLTAANLEAAQQFARHPHPQLAKRPAALRWSVLDCLDHLNRYARFYHPRFQSMLARAQGSTPRRFVRHGWLGGYAIRSMHPQADARPQANKLPSPMKTMRAFDPIRSPQPQADTLADFLAFQTEMRMLLQAAAHIDLGACRTRTTLGPLPTLSFGDALGFNVAHNYRHILQAQRTFAEVPA